MKGDKNYYFDQKHMCGPIQLYIAEIATQEKRFLARSSRVEEFKNSLKLICKMYFDVLCIFGNRVHSFPQILKT